MNDIAKRWGGREIVILLTAPPDGGVQVQGGLRWHTGKVAVMQTGARKPMPVSANGWRNVAVCLVSLDLSRIRSGV